MNAEAPSFDPERILEALHRHGVEHLVVGGVAAQAHGATRATNDLDCVPRSTKQNLQRLAVAMRELGARLRVEGMSDDEARQLPILLDSDMLDRLRVSTWITDAGLFDVLMDIPDRRGGRRDYTDLAARSEERQARGIVVRIAGLEDIIESKEFADRPKDRDALAELRALRHGGAQSPA